MEFLVTGSPVPPGHLPVVIDFLQVSVGGPGKVNRSERPAAEQKPMVFPLQLVGVITDDVAVLVDPDSPGLGGARKLNGAECAVVEQETTHILHATNVGETVLTHNVAAGVNP